MAKKTTPPNPRTSPVKNNQLKRLKFCIDSTEHHEVTCCICDKTDETDYMGEQEFSKALYDEGWRYSVSDKFQVEGVMCPECFKTPDKDRGED